ncbi:DNA polymerase zeta [Coemansia sp. RSA 2131]|nr:DNA polymerase zeta [Coemansia sp. RSA 2131]
MQQQAGTDDQSETASVVVSVLDVQIISIDSYTASPTPADRVQNAPFNVYSEPLGAVPVWPYMYVQYNGPSSIHAVREFGYQLGLSLNNALNLMLKGRDTVYIAAVVPVRGIPFYGHSFGYRPFFRIQFANASILSRASSLLASGAVMGQKFDIFESHLSYTLQFLVDYNLYGMSWMNLDGVRFRSLLPSEASTDSTQAITDSSVAPEHRWVPKDVPDYLVNPAPPVRTSTCELEADVTAANIINRRRVRQRHIHHRRHEVDIDTHFERLVPSLDAIWADENKRRASHGMGEIHPVSSQRQTGSTKSTDRVQTLQQWLNHWRMHSLFESALAGDRRQGNRPSDLELDKVTFSLPTSLAAPNHTDSDSTWLSSWPTCRDVDLDCTQLALGEMFDGDSFYFGGESCSSYNACTLAQEPGLRLDNIAVDAELVAQATPKRNDVNCTSNVGHISNSLSDHDLNNSDASGLDDSSSDMDLFDGMDSAWFEQEVLKIESNRVANTKHFPASSVLPDIQRTDVIPQLDGASDTGKSSCDENSDSDAARGWRQSTRSRVLHKGKRHMLQPLVLRSSSASAERLHERMTGSRKQLVKGLRPIVRDFEFEDQQRSAFDQIIARDSAVAVGLRRSSTGQSATELGSCHRSGRAPRTSKDDIFVDIPHPMGSICKQGLARRSRDDSMNMTSRNNMDVFIDIPHPEGSICRRNGASADQKGVCEHDDAHEFSGSQSDSQADEPASKLNTVKYAHVPPSASHLLSSLAKYGVAEVVVPAPQYSKVSDSLGRNQTVTDASCQSHTEQLFKPECGSGNTGGVCVIESEQRQEERRVRRAAMWGRGAMHALYSTGGSMSNGMRDRWWSFAKPPPKLSEFGDKGIFTASMVATPVQLRQRDQSDLKWGSVLGRLTQRIPVLDPTFAPQTPHSPTLQPRKRTRRPASSKKIPLSLLAAEILSSHRGETLPDPKRDSVILVATCYTTSGLWHESDPGCSSILWSCCPATQLRRLGLSPRIKQYHFASEIHMFQELVKWTRSVDPDILCGYEVQRGSWGFLVERAEHAYGLQLEHALSRLSYRPQADYKRAHDSWGYRKGAAIKIAGRHVLNIWRLLRSELRLTSYTFESTADALLGERSPHHTSSQLATWFLDGPTVARIRVLRYMTYRVSTALRMVYKADIVTRAVEFASVIGIDFHSVITRGSQLRVESLMARIARPELFILPSPTREQVAKQRAAECLPLVLEPQSHYYTDPVIVLDFQSLYPSIIIAYNYCYSTCLGSLEDTATTADSSDGSDHRLGFTNLHIPPGILSEFKDQITVSPNGVMFVKQSVRKGLLGRMLQEILDSRVMIKDAMKQWGDDEVLHKNLDSWQLGLKLIANVTYGYTGASFSGRMPCVEIADAIVQSGRETLESAIRLIHSRYAEWGGKVVYGDTDSVFVWLPGRSRHEAFRIGQEIAAAVTQQNPEPVKLKFEKVYQPCVLLTKKRYAGWMYTSPDQAEPLLDAKGMELVRRDGCAATQRILEGTMSTLFGSNDLSLVKTYVVDQISQILRGKVPVHEFIIAKEVRINTYSERTVPAHAKVAVDNMAHDPQAEPEYGERVPYVVISGPHTRLVDRVVSPRVLLAQPHLRLDFQYYIDKQVLPALDRVLSLVGVDVRSWISEMPRQFRTGMLDALASEQSDSDSSDGADTETRPIHRRARAAGKLNFRPLDQFYTKKICLFCQQSVATVPPHPEHANLAGGRAQPICGECLADSAALATRLGTVQMEIGHQLKTVLDKCAACAGGPRADALQAAELCDSLDCHTMFQKAILSRRYFSWSRVVLPDH